MFERLQFFPRKRKIVVSFSPDGGVRPEAPGPRVRMTQMRIKIRRWTYCFGVELRLMVHKPAYL